MKWPFCAQKSQHYERPMRALVSDGELKKHVCGLEGHLLYKRHRIYWIRRLWVSSWLRKHDKMVVVQGGLVRRFGAVACAASLAIMYARARRLQNRLIHLFLIQLLLFPSVVVV